MVIKVERDGRGVRYKRRRLNILKRNGGIHGGQARERIGSGSRRMQMIVGETRRRSNLVRGKYHLFLNIGTIAGRRLQCCHRPIARIGLDCGRGHVRCEHIRDRL